MDYLVQVQRGIDYIEANLEGDLAPAEVARHAGISQWHFQRIFKALTNETLGTYIRSRRLASALHKLTSSDERVLEIALGAGFESQEAFTRAFKKAFGVTPASYRRRRSRLPFPTKVRFDAAYLRHLDGQLSLEPALYVQPELQLVGLSTRFYSLDSEKNNLGAKLPQLWRAFLPRLGEIEGRVPGLCYGVVRQTSAMTDELDYYAAVAAPAATALPDGMVRLRLPAAQYARFEHRGPAAHVDRTVNYIYSSWLARSGMRHTYGADLEFYGPGYSAEADDSVLHYAIPVQGDDAPAADGAARPDEPDEA